MKPNAMSLLISLLVLSIFVMTPVFAQNEDTLAEAEAKKFEVGGHYTFMRRTDANTALELFRRVGLLHPSFSPGHINESGLGVRFGYNFSRNVALEVEGNLFPEDKTANIIIGVPISVTEPGGRKLQAVAGPKIGIRRNKFGLFGKVRPGIIRLGRYDAVQLVGTPTNFFVLGDKRNKVGFFNVDIGGVFEYYPSKRTIFRVDVGNTIVYYHKLPPKDINPSMTRHNLQTSVGFGFRF